MVSSVSKNTTLFDNFTVEWVNFNLLTCALPNTVNISLMACLPSVLYKEMNDVDCLTTTAVNVDQTTCQSTTNAAAYISSSPITTKQPTIQTITNTKAQTSVSAAAVVSTLMVTTMSVTTEKQATTGKIGSSVIATSTPASSSATVTIGKTDTSTANISTFHSSTTTTTTTTTVITATPTTSTVITTTTTTTTVIADTPTTRTVITATPTTSTVITATTTTTTVIADTTTTSTVITATTTTSTVITATTTTTTVIADTTTTTTTTTTTRATNTASTTTTTGYKNLFSCQNDSYIGTYCNISSDVCTVAQPCENGGTCFPNDTLLDGHYCECLTGYKGYNCENNEQACTESKCWHNGTCVPINATIASIDGLNFKCECIEGYDGTYCELGIDLCVNITCENRGICQTVAMQWKCSCLDSAYYYGDLCQFKTNKLKIREILSSSFAFIAIGVISVTCGFVVVMDVLKYVFHIDPVECERDNYRKRREAQRRARRPIKPNQTKIALRFQYVS
ncbi:unnamed protein product [Rotaria magnacalcarata]|uniref:EGF-like domain-containing protein n=1 Tax=Rotaria magnacalcarata TaxID=392030 RepID=A0A816WXB4_9BILA|nr:unnamed protein product [Rotaria magnacalcarata]CAF3771471.1 unnamed protein product [Rotaria magnacalcarata]